MKHEKRKIRWWQKVPHLFSKIVVCICICMGVSCSVWAMCMVEQIGAEPSMTLGVIMGFFGGELLLLCYKTVKGEKKND